jgi:hypothetical protein
MSSPNSSRRTTTSSEDVPVRTDAIRPMIRLIKKQRACAYVAGSSRDRWKLDRALKRTFAIWSQTSLALRMFPKVFPNGMKMALGEISEGHFA